MFHIIRIVCFLSIVFSVVFLRPPLVAAQQTNTIIITPAYQEINFDENDREVVSSFQLQNDSSEMLEFELDVIPYSMADLTGSIVFANPILNEAVGDISYVRFAVSHVQLQPGEKKKINFTVENRPNLAPGGHYLAVVSRLVKDDQQERQVLPALSTLLLIRKKTGEQVNISLTNVDDDQAAIFLKLPTRLLLTFENQGNIHLVPRGEIEITDQWGRIVKQGVINQDSLYILPGTRRVIANFARPASMPLPFSFLSMSVQGYAQGYDSGFSYHSSFFYVSWFGVVAIGLCVVITVLVIKVFMEQKRRKIET